MGENSPPHAGVRRPAPRPADARTPACVRANRGLRNWKNLEKRLKNGGFKKNENNGRKYLHKPGCCGKLSAFRAAVVQWIERQTTDLNVAGSTPASRAS